MFASRTEWDLSENSVARRRQELARRGIPVLDLTGSNPTQAGLTVPEEWLAPLANSGGLLYDPQLKGDLTAREAICSLYTAKGARVGPERILLTASTSEAYSHLFRLLADPGDEILIPQPGYPLFDYLADLSDVRPVPYRLRLKPNGFWRLDLKSLEAALTPRSRAVVAVSPNNPTGSCIQPEELEGLAALCRRQGLPLIADEVFAEYRSSGRSTLLGAPGLLTFALGGISKLLGLPQMKLAWIACSGPDDLVEPAVARLELIADTFLSVNAPVQRALPRWLRQAPAIQAQIRQRIQTNLETLREELASSSCRRFPYEGGWSVVLQRSDRADSQGWAEALLEERHLLVHPGYLFGFEEPGIIVLGLLCRTEEFRQGIRRLA